MAIWGSNGPAPSGPGPPATWAVTGKTWTNMTRRRISASSSTSLFCQRVIIEPRDVSSSSSTKNRLRWPGFKFVKRIWNFDPIGQLCLSGFILGIHSLYINCLHTVTHKPKPIVSSDAQIVPLPSWLLSLAWKPIKHKHRDLFLKFWLCLHPKPVLRPLRGALQQQLQLDAGVAEVARASAASAARVQTVVW